MCALDREGIQPEGELQRRRDQIGLVAAAAMEQQHIVGAKSLRDRLKLRERATILNVPVDPTAGDHQEAGQRQTQCGGGE